MDAWSTNVWRYWEQLWHILVTTGHTVISASSWQNDTCTSSLLIGAVTETHNDVQTVQFKHTIAYRIGNLCCRSRMASWLSQSQSEIYKYISMTQQLILDKAPRTMLSGPCSWNPNPMSRSVSPNPEQKPSSLFHRQPRLNSRTATWQATYSIPCCPSEKHLSSLGHSNSTNYKIEKLRMISAVFLILLPLYLSFGIIPRLVLVIYCKGRFTIWW